MIFFLKIIILLIYKSIIITYLNCIFTIYKYIIQYNAQYTIIETTIIRCDKIYCFQLLLVHLILRKFHMT